MSTVEAGNPLSRASTHQSIESSYHRHRAWLLSFLNRRFGSLVGEDAAQEAFARTLASGAELRNPRAFLAKVAIRAALEEIRRRPEVGFAYEAVVAVQPDAEQAVLLEQLVHALPEPIRDVFLLSRFGGLSNGFRARAQEVAQERLGDLSRADAERRVWRETQADRFTALDRRLLQAADAERCVDDGVGVNDAWSALTRGRLRRLEALGLALRAGHRFQLDAELEPRLRSLQLRQDIIRTLHQRRLESGREPAVLGDQPVLGRVVARGHHDELGGAAWVVVRDPRGQEHYARLKFGQSTPALGRSIELIPTAQGAQINGPSRSAGLGR